MFTYTYSISTRTRYGTFQKIGFGTEEQMFAAAVQVDHEGGELLDAVREVWEVREDVAHFVRFEHYRNGRPIAD